MFRKKQSKYGPATQEMLDIVEGRRKPNPKQQALLDKQQAEFEANLTDEDKEFLRDLEAKEAFDKKYVLRRDYTQDLELARSKGRTEAAIFFIFILPPLLVTFFIILQALGWVGPGEFGLR